MHESASRHKSYDPKNFSTVKIAINIDALIKHLILIKSKHQIQFGVFLRGHFGTPMDPAPVLFPDVGTGGKPSTWFPPGDS